MSQIGSFCWRYVAPSPRAKYPPLFSNFHHPPSQDDMPSRSFCFVSVEQTLPEMAFLRSLSSAATASILPTAIAFASPSSSSSLNFRFPSLSLKPKPSLSSPFASPQSALHMEQKPPAQVSTAALNFSAAQISRLSLMISSLPSTKTTDLEVFGHI